MRNLTALYRQLPSVDELLRSHPAATASAARIALEQVRAEVAAGEHDSASLSRRLLSLNMEPAHTLRPVINATGVVLHTNLGRAPLSQRALDRVVAAASGYCNLELDLDSGKRGKRERIAEQCFLLLLAAHTKRPLAELVEQYGVFVANNCAAATFLTLNSLAASGEVLVSRGELVEIGGGFRIPEILEKAGATMREVGTTNKTHLADYERAITEHTKLILRVHRSNFRMSGFTHRPDLARLVQLGRQRGVPVFEDQGTGLIEPLGQEATMLDSLKAGVDIVAASGDKLLGGPQAGLIVGRRESIDVISRNPLARAFRVDKLTYAALEATLLDYASGRATDIPAARMIALQPDDILLRAQKVAASIERATIRRGHSVIGGGTTPGHKLRTFLIELNPDSYSPEALLKRLREATPPVIARIARDRVLIDLRTVPPELDALLARIVREASGL